MGGELAAEKEKHVRTTGELTAEKQNLTDAKTQLTKKKREFDAQLARKTEENDKLTTEKQEREKLDKRTTSPVEVCPEKTWYHWEASLLVYICFGIQALLLLGCLCCGKREVQREDEEPRNSHYGEENPKIKLANQIKRLQQRNRMLQKRNMNLRQEKVSQPLKRTRAQIQWCDLPWYSKLTDTDKDHRIFTKQFVKAKVKPREANIAIRSMRKLQWKPTVSKPKPKKVRAREKDKKDKKDKKD